MTTEMHTGRPDDGEVEVLAWWDDHLRSGNPLVFPGYEPAVGEEESVRTAAVRLHGTDAVWIDADFARSGGTMGVVAGERIVRALDSATALRQPVVMTVSTGGARLQEGMYALVQMARTASAVARHRAAGLVSVAHLAHPTTGGVYASWASLASIRAAAPGATIGFGGPRVVEQVTGHRPPADSHTAEAAFRHGLVDALVPTAERWSWIAAAIGARPAPRLATRAARPAGRVSAAFTDDAYARLLETRSSDRPSGLEWAAWITDSWVELNGSDAGIRAGIATIEERRAVVVAMDRHALGGTHLPGPGAFELAVRAIDLAGQLGLPVLTIIDTPGADPSPTAEAAGVAGAIARTLLALAELRTPSVGLVVGEGGSGGAMALAHTDRLLALDRSTFAVIGPEAGAAILYRDAGRAPELARSFALRAEDLADRGIVDVLLPEDVDQVRKVVAAELAGTRAPQKDDRWDRVTERAVLSTRR
ncbi:carboxyl transferase domain-containing protein [Nocardioides sp. YIM 152588]|uniref:carboxyl transferase domain-containing protein n=1 Tax=Nocardioides sp. YIM 152588 TaxID=3158259 RepID=UPI0032E39880